MRIADSGSGILWQVSYTAVAELGRKQADRGSCILVSNIMMQIWHSCVSSSGCNQLRQAFFVGTMQMLSHHAAQKKKQARCIKLHATVWQEGDCCTLHGVAVELVKEQTSISAYAWSLAMWPPFSTRKRVSLPGEADTSWLGSVSLVSRQVRLSMISRVPSGSSSLWTT